MTQGIEEIIKEILADPKLTYPQRLTALAGALRTRRIPCLLAGRPSGLRTGILCLTWGREMHRTVPDMCSLTMISL